MPMTLRTIKKKSKKALPILRAHYPNAVLGEAFAAVRGENYHGFVVRCTHGSGDPSMDGSRRRCECTYHPLKGTPMFGAVVGYYEPEWEEGTALEALREAVEMNDRPATMSDREWRRTLAISGTRPFTEDEMQALWGDVDTPAPTTLPAGRET